MTIDGRTAAVQVAARGAWMIADIDKMTAMSVDLYVLVDVTEGRRDFYIVPGDELRIGVRERYEESMASVGGFRPRNPNSLHTAIHPAHLEAWRNLWSLFDQAAEPVSEDAASGPFARRRGVRQVSRAALPSDVRLSAQTWWTRRRRPRWRGRR